MKGIRAATLKKVTTIYSAGVVFMYDCLFLQDNLQHSWLTRHGCRLVFNCVDKVLHYADFNDWHACMQIFSGAK
jgi:hypothetical protein